MSVQTPMVFMSYRRGESSPHAIWLYERITARFGEDSVFIDFKLEPAVDFVKRTTELLGACRVMLVVIGPTWATVEGRPGRPRLFDDRDFVRFEVETALQRPEVTVIPVLVDGARMPDPDQLPESLSTLPDLNGIELSKELRRWDDDVGRLLRTLERLLSATSGGQAAVLVADPSGRAAVAPGLRHEPLPGELGAEGAAAAVTSGTSTTYPPTPSAPPRARVLKSVTVLYCAAQVSGLDTESRFHVMKRWYEELSRAIEHHGGTVQNWSGDAVRARFGIPTLHEDDALRAIRAADEARGALTQLAEELHADRGVTLETTTGVSSGEVVVGQHSPGEYLVTGEAVEIAAWLGQAASPGEILLGGSTYRLVRDAIKAVPVEPLSVSGRKDSLSAFRLTGVVALASEVARRLDSPMVGRGRELAFLNDAFEGAVRDSHCQIATVLGTAGVGKSRLTQELVDGLRDRARILQGRCLPYGEGITFWPVAGVVKESAGIGEGDSRHEARSKIEALLPQDEDAGLIAEYVAGALGMSEAAAQPEETFWAMRKLLEALATEGPVVVVFDDVHWGEPTFLELIEYLDRYYREGAILLVCLARPELWEKRPSLASTGISLVLEPLDPLQSETLIQNLLGDVQLPQDASRQIAEAAEGNPLFVEEMLHMLVDDGRLRRENGSWRAAGSISRDKVPPTINALLGERLDRLHEAERGVLERGAVIGQEFWRAAVRELSPADVRSDLGYRLDTLVRKELIWPGGRSLRGEEAFRFAHILIRDVAYEGLLAHTRAELHERFADWLEERAGERVAEYEEILGYHLEQAYGYREARLPVDEFSQRLRYREARVAVDERSLRLARRAAERLIPAGARAFARSDMPATVNLYERAAALLPESDPALLALLPDLAYALRATGALSRADQVVNEAIEAARSAGDRRLELHAEVERAFGQLYTDSDVVVEDVVGLAERAIPVFEEAGDEELLARAWHLLGDAHSTACRNAASAEALERALTYAQRAGDRREEAQLLTWIAFSHYWGPTPVGEAIRHHEEILERAKGERVVTAGILLYLAGLKGMEGRFEEARKLYAQARAIAEELGLRFFMPAMSLVSGQVELLAGNPDAAERELRSAYETLTDMGEKGVLRA